MRDYKNVNTSESVDLANWVLRVLGCVATLVIFYGSLIWAAS